VIALETIYAGCQNGRVCYSISHSNINDVPAGGTTLRFSIYGTINQESVQGAGSWGVQTQLIRLTDNAYFNIDKNLGLNADSFRTEAGAVFMNINKESAIVPNSYRVFEPDVQYTIFFTMNEYVPSGGRIKI
jgi:hypothetical protein